MAELEAAILDMDGTLVDVPYDWLEIRRLLDIHEPSIIEALNGLPHPQREEKWGVLEAIEEEATQKAELAVGARELLDLLRERGLRTALVTNNSQKNTAHLLALFRLRFDVVITRDSGLWKPSGAPVTEALRRLDSRPHRALAVGDSRYDVQAATEAGCREVYLVGNGASDLEAGDYQRFPDLNALRLQLEALL